MGRAHLSTSLALAFLLGACGRDDASVDPAASSPRSSAPRVERTRPAETAGPSADAAAATATSADAAAQRPALNGSVRAFDGRALPAAIVRAEPVPVFPNAPESRQPSETTADADARFALRGLAAGDWALLVSAEGALRTYVATVRVPERERFDLVLQRGSVIEGTVIDETTHAAVPSARVRLEGRGGWIGDARTSPDGRFRMASFAGVRSRESFRIDAPGYASLPAESSEVDVDAAVLGRHEVTLFATRGHTLTGRVVGPDGPLPGAKVVLTAGGASDDPEQRWQATTDADGRFAIEHLMEGSLQLGYWIVATADGFVRQGESDPELASEPPLGDSLSPSKDGWTAPDLVMRRRVPLGRCTIEGRVVDEEEHPLAGAKVATMQGARSVHATTDAEGRYVLTDVPVDPSDGSVGVEIESVPPHLFTRSVDASDGARVVAEDLFVEKATSASHVRGRVTGPDGAPVSGARVVAAALRTEAIGCVFGHVESNEPGRGATTRTTADGTFDVALGPDLTIVVAVVASGLGEWIGEFDRESIDDPLEIRLAAPRAVTGRVVRAGTDTGVEGLDVELVRRNVTADFRTGPDELVRCMRRVLSSTGADGSFRVDDLPAEAWIAFSGAGWVGVEASTEELVETRFRVEIEPALVLAGRAQFADGRPCSGVRVTAFEIDPDAQELGGTAEPSVSDSVATSADGSFEIDSLPRGRYWLEFAGGRPEVARRVVPFEAGTRDVHVELVPGRTIRGRVLRPRDGAAEKLVVRASAAGVGRPWTCDADADGAFAIGGLGDGEFTVACDADGCFPWAKSGVRADGEPVEIRLDEGLAVAGTILTAEGEALRFADLVVEPAGPETAVARKGRTDAAGHFRVSALTAGRWRVRLASEEDRLPAVVVDAGSESLDLRTEPKPVPATPDGEDR